MKGYLNSIEYMQDEAAGLRYDFGRLVDKARAEPGRAVLVDVGGGKGHSLAAILRDHPGLPRERCVLQDRGEVIEAVEEVNDPVLSTIRKMAADFHTDQPVKGRHNTSIHPECDELCHR
ncbi:hypothetical protein IMZ48_21910 [Candidatus Bathyarchaeota archaeon]|nr:hypothetical protein [Candidatus Bathyarchaeota archaeon]